MPNPVVKPEVSIPRLSLPGPLCVIADCAWEKIVQEAPVLLAHHHAMGSVQESSIVESVGDIAVIHITGYLTKNRSIFTDIFDGTSMMEAKEAIEQTAGDDQIESILLKIDTGGGDVDGAKELADAVFEARQVKTIIAFVDGMALSGGQWIAAQAEAVYAKRTSLLGSIGVKAPELYDFSKLYEEAGIKPVPIDTGELKSAGMEGTKITPKQIEHFQGLVDDTMTVFVDAVARGRGMSRPAVLALADARLLTAPEAQAAGLIDGIQSYEETLAQLQAQSEESQIMPKKTLTPSGGQAQGEAVPAADPEQTPAPTAQAATVNNGDKPATLAELKGAFSKASAEWLVSALDGGLTMQQAQASRSDLLQAENDALQTKLKVAETTKPKPQGVQPLGTSISSSGATKGDQSSEDGFSEVVQSKVDGGMDRHRAVALVAKTCPELHQAYLLETNPSRGSQRLIEDKFGMAVS